jgi:putative FmdB family regulatory protein
MPIYEYKCAVCDYRFELIQKFSDVPASVCPNCGAEKAERLISAPAIQFKGSGWYITDYAKKNSPAPSPKDEVKKDISTPTTKNDTPK